MNNLVKGFIASIGVATSCTGIAISTSELSEIVSIITAIIGLLIVVICNLIIPIIRWFIKAKKDGKIDDEEITELCDTIENGVKEIDNSKNKKKGDK